MSGTQFGMCRKRKKRPLPCYNTRHGKILGVQTRTAFHAPFSRGRAGGAEKHEKAGSRGDAGAMPGGRTYMLSPDVFGQST